MNKFLAVSMACALLLTSFSTGARAQAEGSFAPNELKKGQVEMKLEAAEKKLKDRKIKSDKLAKLKEKGHAEFVAAIAENNNWGETETNNFIDGIINFKNDEGMKLGKVVEEGVYEVDGEKFPGFGTKKNIERVYPGATKKMEQEQTLNQNSLTAAEELSDCDKGITTWKYGQEMLTGPHYIYTAKPGYHKAYMHVQLPQVYLANPATTRAYEFFGFYHDAGGGGDAGLFSRDGVNWKIGGNIYPAPAGTTGWFEGGNIINKNTHAEVLLVAWEEDETLFVSVYNKLTGSTLSQISYYAPGRGFNKYNPSTVINREHSMSYFCKMGDLTDGSYSIYGKHFDVLLANSAGSTRNWTPYETLVKGPKDTYSEQRTITISGNEYGDESAIRFNLPRQ
ncbi:hypothetical protein J2T17_006359 [Paenibacillus mucilaginosus]|uniref:hypothetical protein n=1 Tax=Paenibacillus mucilaginosus TaxID=61624 RepID=UPI003D261C6F